MDHIYFFEDVLSENSGSLSYEFCMKIFNNMNYSISEHTKDEIKIIISILNRSSKVIDLGDIDFLPTIDFLDDGLVKTIGLSNVFISERLLESGNFMDLDDSKDIISNNFNLLFNSRSNILIDINKREPFINVVTALIDFYEIDDCDKSLINKIKGIETKGVMFIELI